MLRNALVSNVNNMIGLATARALADYNVRVYALAYKQDVNDKNIKIISIDAYDYSTVNNAVRDILKDIMSNNKNDNIDILVNVPFYAQIGMLEDLKVDDFVAQFNANLFNVISLIKAVVPIMKRHGKGLIINIGSLAGIVGFPGISAYSSSMFALEGLTECLRYELMNYGIYTVIVEPGAVKSDKALIRLSNQSDNPSFESIYKGLMHLIEHGLDAEDVAKTIVSIVKSGKPRLRYIVGEHAFVMLDAKRSMSEDEFEELVRRDVGF
jgi:Short-chain dehydrogenases of various substrate specificities